MWVVCLLWVVLVQWYFSNSPEWLFTQWHWSEWEKKKPWTYSSHAICISLNTCMFDCFFGGCFVSCWSIALSVKQWKLRKTKVLKIKIYCMLIFHQKQVNPFSSSEKLPKFCKKYFVKEQMWKIWAFLGKKLNGWFHKLETLHEDNLGCILKKPRKQQIYGGSRSLWISRLKSTNIFQIFA